MIHRVFCVAFLAVITGCSGASLPAPAAPHAPELASEPQDGLVHSKNLLRAVVDLPFDEAELTIRTELQLANVNIIGTLDVQKGLSGHEVSFAKYKVIQFCRLQDGLVLFRDNPDYGAFIPCSILLYEKNGKTVLVSRRPTAIVHEIAGHTPNAKSIAMAAQVEKMVREVMGAVVEEAKARAK